MELEITSKRENHLLKRVEVKFQAKHPSEATPNRDSLRAEIAKSLSAKKEFVILDWVRSDFGRTRTVGYAKVYSSKEDALKIERKPILVRMGLVAAEVRVKKEKKAAPAKEAPRKEEAKPAKKEEGPKKAEGAKPAEKGKEEKPAEKGKKEEAKPAEKGEGKKPAAKGGK